MVTKQSAEEKDMFMNCCTKEKAPKKVTARLRFTVIWLALGFSWGLFLSLSSVWAQGQITQKDRDLLSKDRAFVNNLTFEHDDSVRITIKTPEHLETLTKGQIVVRVDVDTGNDENDDPDVWIALDDYETLLRAKPNDEIYRRLMANVPDGKHELTVYAYYDVAKDDKTVRHFNRESLTFRQQMAEDFSFSRVWLPYIYLYGFGGIVFLLGVYTIKRQKTVDEENPKEKFFFRLLFYGYAWFMGIHLFFTVLALVLS